MPLRDGGPEDVLGRALLDRRAQFHATFRVAARVVQAGLSRRPKGPRRRLVWAGASALWDVGVGIVLERSRRPLLMGRLVADAVDTALWSLHHDRADLASLTGVPLAMEAGIRLGTRGLLVPTVNALVTSVARSAKGRSRSLASFRFQVMAVGCGAGLARYEKSRRNATFARHRHEVEAQCQMAHLAGQNDVAMGADSVIDLLSRTDPLLASGSGSTAHHGTTGRELAAWKQSLGAATAGHASYLGLVFAQFERTHNGARPDLAADVSFEVVEGDGSVTLTPRQATMLVGVLDDLAARGELRGRLGVRRLGHGANADPNSPVCLSVADHVIELPPDPRSDLDPFDVGPLGFATAALWTLDSLLPTGPRSSAKVVGPVAAVEAALVVWSHRRLVRNGRQARGRILAAALATGALDCIAVTTTMAHTRSADGVHFLPAARSITPTLLVLALYWEDLPTGERYGTVLAVVAIVVLGIVVHPDRPPPGKVLLELAWPLSAVVSMASLDASFAAQEAEIRAETTSSDRQAVSDAFDKGRASVIDLAASGFRRTSRAFEELRATLDPAIAAEVERRLGEVAKRLESL